MHGNKDTLTNPVPLTANWGSLSVTPFARCGSVYVITEVNHLFAA